MANGKREEKSTLGKIADSVKSFFSGAANDFAIGTGMKDDPGRNSSGAVIGPFSETSYEARTRKAVAQNAKNAAYYADNNSSLSAANKSRAAARRSAMSVGAVGAAPSVPDPNAIGKTEQALLDAQKKGRSATIETSSQGLLSDEDSTRKKRSLMGGLLT
tara:strand:- start:8 stop:487 length:480 start_codon:yes stop_codon:yes gene_type:complete